MSIAGKGKENQKEEAEMSRNELAEQDIFEVPEDYESDIEDNIYLGVINLKVNLVMKNLIQCQLQLHSSKVLILGQQLL